VRSAADEQGVPSPLWVESPLTPAELFASWCGVGSERAPAVASALVEAARSILPICSPADSTTERRWQWESNDNARDTTEAGDIARLLLSGEATTPIEAVTRALGQLRNRGLSVVEQFQRFGQLMADRCRPIVATLAGRVDPWVSTIAYAVHVTELTPEARLILIVESAAWLQLRELLDSHAVALLLEQLVDWAENAASLDAGVADQPKEVGGSNQSTGSIEQADDSVAWAADASLRQLQRRARLAVRTALGVHADPNQTAPPAAHAEARSLAEALLAAALANDHRTAGLFSLNGDGGFWFGSRRAEIDLFCQSLGIAIEVDGYFHFLDKQAYRRDRAKDWLMQRRGYLVLRFLAEDVSDCLSRIIESVAEAVTLRRDMRAESDQPYGKRGQP